MADFKPDRELESKEFNETFKTSTSARKPRDIYNTWPTWAKNLSKIVAGITFIIILVLIGRSIHHHADKNAKITAPSQSAISKKTSATPSLAKAGNSGSKSTSSNSSTTGSSSQSGKIPNTGPGDVAAMFVVTAGAGASVHYVVSRRRA